MDEKAKTKKRMQDIMHVEEVAATQAEAEGMEESKKGKRARTLFDKYGLPGLAIIGPFSLDLIYLRLWE